MKKILSLMIIILLLLQLCSCYYDDSDIDDVIGAFSEMLNYSTSAETQTIPIPENFTQLLDKFERINDSYYKRLDSTLSSASNIKYVYGKTVYERGSAFLDILSMFCEEKSEEALETYFSILSYTDCEYTVSESGALFTAQKNGASYRYELRYGVDREAFTFVLTVNGVLSEFFSTDMNEGVLAKTYYNSSFGRIYEVLIKQDGSANMCWDDIESYPYDIFEKELIGPENFALSGLGYIRYDGNVIDGVIK